MNQQSLSETDSKNKTKTKQSGIKEATLNIKQPVQPSKMTQTKTEKRSGFKKGLGIVVGGTLLGAGYLTYRHLKSGGERPDTPHEQYKHYLGLATDIIWDRVMKCLEHNPQYGVPLNQRPASISMDMLKKVVLNWVDAYLDEKSNLDSLGYTEWLESDEDSDENRASFLYETLKNGPHVLPSVPADLCRILASSKDWLNPNFYDDDVCFDPTLSPVLQYDKDGLVMATGWYKLEIYWNGNPNNKVACNWIPADND